jgi:hypothetical protein
LTSGDKEIVELVLFGRRPPPIIDATIVEDLLNGGDEGFKSQDT